MLLSRILESLIKVGCPSRFKSHFYPFFSLRHTSWWGGVVNKKWNNTILSHIIQTYEKLMQYNLVKCRKEEIIDNNKKSKAVEIEECSGV